MELLSEDPKYNLEDEIIYRGEGNSSIVIALKNEAKVIRLLKKDGKIMKSSLDHHLTLHPMRSIKFIHLIMRPLTNPFLRGSTELVHLKSNFINRISKRVETERPVHRLDKTLHLDDQYALIMDDLCTIPLRFIKDLPNGHKDLFGPTISIEIKPKQGFLPVHRLIMKSSANEQSLASIRSSCLYGSTQLLKLARGRIKEVSNYCPVNLFSGCPIKMRSALRGLLRNPQNNFRIFKDLVLAYGEGNRTKFGGLFKDFLHRLPIQKVTCVDQERQFIDMLVQCLLREFTTDPAPEIKEDFQLEERTDRLIGIDENIHPHQNCNDVCMRHTAILVCDRCDKRPATKRAKTIRLDDDHDKPHSLPNSCVLASVLKAQKLDTVGAHEARKMLNWLLENSSSMDVLEELSRPQIPHGFGSPCRLLNETKERYYFRKVWEFLVSLTSKDCSIIITMRRIKPERQEDLLENQPSLKNHIVVDSRTKSCYLFNVGIADLDQKMPLKINRICENLNQTIHQLVIHEAVKQGNRDNLVGPYLHEGRKLMIPS